MVAGVSWSQSWLPSSCLRAIIAPVRTRTVGGTIVDDEGDSAEPVRIMTYKELATVLGIDEESAQRRTQRRKWRRMRGNDGKARVAVPLSVIPEAPMVSRADDPPDNEGTVPPTVTDALAPLLLDLAARAKAAREALDAARAEAMTIRERAAKAEGEAEVLRSALEGAQEVLARLRRRGLLARL